MFDINGSELLVLLAVALLVLGPNAVREALSGLKRATQWAKTTSYAMRQSAKGVAGEADPEITNLFEVVGFSAEEDPRRMIRKAVQEEAAAWVRELGQASEK